MKLGKFEDAVSAIQNAGVISIMREPEQRILWDIAQAMPRRLAGARPQVIEVGTAYGGTAALLALAGCQVVTIDNWECGKRAEFEQGMQRLGLAYRVFDGSMQPAGLNTVRSFDAALWRDRQPPDDVQVAQLPFQSGNLHNVALPIAGLVIVDGAHTGDEPRLDLSWYCGLVAPGGYLAVDDVANGHPAVTVGLLRWLNERPHVQSELANQPTWKLVWAEPYVDTGHDFVKLVVFQKV